MKELTIEHLIPYSNHKLGLMDLSSLKHIPTTMILEGFDLHLKDEPIIAERTHWKLSEIKPILHPLSDLTKEELRDFNKKTSDFHLGLILKSVLKSQLPLDDEYGFMQWLFSKHYDVLGLIPEDLAIDINTLKK